MTPNLLVIDISHHNNVRDFAAIKAAGVVGVIHKATQGTRYVDPYYERRRRLALAAGLLWGGYHFCTGDDVSEQVEHFYNVAAPDDNTLMALDYEANRGHDMSLQQCRDFLQLLDAKLGRETVLYSGNLIKEKLGAKVDKFFSSHRLWLAQYGPTPRVQASWKEYWLWQYTDGTANLNLGKHSIPGVDGLLDCNHYAGTADELAVEWAL